VVSDLLTVGQVADLLGVTARSVERWLQRGTLHGEQTDQRWLVSRSNLREFVARCKWQLPEAAARLQYVTMEDKTTPS